MNDTGKVNNLLAQIPGGEEEGSPPIHLWNPPSCGDIDMHIAHDGSWFCLGTPIRRKPMMKLFSNVIRCDGDDYSLVTPVEKVGTRVDDTPFVAVAPQVQGEDGAQALRFTANVKNEVEADAGHSLRVKTDPRTQEPTPYLRVCDSLEALVHRNVFYQLVELTVPRRIDGIEWLGVWNHDESFPIGPQPD